MSPTDLKKLLSSLTLTEKVGQLVQLSGDFLTQNRILLLDQFKKWALIQKWYH